MIQEAHRPENEGKKLQKDWVGAVLRLPLKAGKLGLPFFVIKVWAPLSGGGTVIRREDWLRLGLM